MKSGDIFLQELKPKKRTFILKWLLNLPEHKPDYFDYIQYYREHRN